jgi:hypothetical protein
MRGVNHRAVRPVDDQILQDLGQDPALVEVGVRLDGPAMGAGAVHRAHPRARPEASSASMPIRTVVDTGGRCRRSGAGWPTS